MNKHFVNKLAFPNRFSGSSVGPYDGDHSHLFESSSHASRRNGQAQDLVWKSMLLGQSRFLGRGCDEALFSEKNGFSVKRGEAIHVNEGLGKDLYNSVKSLFSCLVDVSDIFYFFCLGGGKGECEASGGGGGFDFCWKSQEGGGFPGRGGAEGPGGCLRRIGEFGGGG